MKGKDTLEVNCNSYPVDKLVIQLCGKVVSVEAFMKSPDDEPVINISRENLPKVIEFLQNSLDSLNREGESHD